MGARILVIEDNPANMELVEYVLGAFGYEVLCASDGETGVGLAKTGAVDLIVCDLQLPGIDGFEVARQIAAMPSLAGVPRVAVTAYAMVGDRERVLAGGFDAYIAKPIDPQTFVPQIAALLKTATPSGKRRGSNAIPAAVPARPIRARALMVDDSHENANLLSSLLGSQGIAVDSYLDITQALAGLDARKPDLIISDLHIGRERGEDFFKSVKARPGLRAIPFIFISSTTIRDADRIRALADGADRFIVRPIDNARLLAEIEACLALHKGA